MLKALWLNPSIVLIVIKLFVDRNNYAFIMVYQQLFNRIRITFAGAAIAFSCAFIIQDRLERKLLEENLALTSSIITATPFQIIRSQSHPSCCQFSSTFHSPPYSKRRLSHLFTNIANLEGLTPNGSHSIYAYRSVKHSYNTISPREYTRIY